MSFTKKVSFHSKKYKAVIMSRENISDRTEKQTDEEGVIYFITDGKRFNPDGGPSVIFPDGVKVWTDEEGKYHRDDDLPAIEEENSPSQRWFQHGVLYRPSGEPAVIIDYENNGIISHYYTDSDGKIHRENDLPAVIKTDGFQEWSLHGVLHREGDLPAIINPRLGRIQYYKNGKLHRENGPADIRNEYRYWYQNDEMKRKEQLIDGTWVVC